MKATRESDVTGEQVHLVIRYPQKRGFILEAHKLQQLVGEYFDLSVSAQEQGDASFTLSLAGETIYSESVPDCSRIHHYKLLEVISNHIDPLTRIPTEASETFDQDSDQDPEHRRWLNSVCSGE